MMVDITLPQLLHKLEILYPNSAGLRMGVWVRGPTRLRSWVTLGTLYPHWDLLQGCACVVWVQVLLFVVVTLAQSTATSDSACIPRVRNKQSNKTAMSRGKAVSLQVYWGHDFSGGSECRLCRGNTNKRDCFHFFCRVSLQMHCWAYVRSLPSYIFLGLTRIL